MNCLKGLGAARAPFFRSLDHALNMFIGSWQGLHCLVEEASCTSYAHLNDRRIAGRGARDDQLALGVPEGLSEPDVEVLNHCNRYCVQDIDCLADLRMYLRRVSTITRTGGEAGCCGHHAYYVPRGRGLQRAVVSVLLPLYAMGKMRCPDGGTSGSQRPYRPGPRRDFGFAQGSNRRGRGRRDRYYCRSSLRESSPKQGSKLLRPPSRQENHDRCRSEQSDHRYCSLNSRKGRILKGFFYVVNAAAEIFQHGGPF
jgi:hypothetical protein